MGDSASLLFRVKPHRCGIPRDVKADQLQGMNTTKPPAGPPTLRTLVETEILNTESNTQPRHPPATAAPTAVPTATNCDSHRNYQDRQGPPRLCQNLTEQSGSAARPHAGREGRHNHPRPESPMATGPRLRHFFE